MTDLGLGAGMAVGRAHLALVPVQVVRVLAPRDTFEPIAGLVPHRLSQRLTREAGSGRARLRATPIAFIVAVAHGG